MVLKLHGYKTLEKDFLLPLRKYLTINLDITMYTLAAYPPPPPLTTFPFVSLTIFNFSKGCGGGGGSRSSSGGGSSTPSRKSGGKITERKMILPISFM